MALRIARLGVALAGGLVWVAACNPSTDVGGLPCDGQGQCLAGYSCLVNTCIAEGSLATGETCTESGQCAGFPNNVCGAEPFNCRRRCSDNYFSPASGVCDNGEFCRPEPDRDQPDRWIGTCIASECTFDQDCRDRTATTARACVAVTPIANACMQTCEVMVTPGGTQDTCGSASGLSYCQPIGPSGRESLVCLSRLDADTTGLPNPGDLCKVTTAPCRPGAACVGEGQTFCRPYCDVGLNDVLNVNPLCPTVMPYCCSVLSGGVALYAVCGAGDC